MGDSGGESGRHWVLLRHEMPDGSWHYDWMLEWDSTPDAERALVSFRVSVRPDERVGMAIEGERIGAHRRVYLEFEGDVSGGRGRVVRVARGDLVGLIMSDDSIDVALRIGRAVARWQGSPMGRGSAGGGPVWWRFEPVDPVAPGRASGA
ncbi:MAG: hypothetical protein R3B68_13485 [Phycisphaerales bacterium]